MYQVKDISLAKRGRQKNRCGVEGLRTAMKCFHSTLFGEWESGFHYWGRDVRGNGMLGDSRLRRNDRVSGGRSRLTEVSEATS